MKKIILKNIAEFLELLCAALDRSQWASLYAAISIKVFKTHCILAIWAYQLDEKYKLKIWSENNI